MLNNLLFKLALILLSLNAFTAHGTQSTELNSEAYKGTVLITGANRGLGLALSRHFISDGYQVFGTARKPAKAIELKESGAQVVQLDVTNDESIAAMAKTLTGVPIDIIVNNAGYVNSQTRGLESFKNTTREEYLRTYNINTIGPVMVTRAL